MTVGQRIKLRRKELEMTVDELAKTLNKNRATVYRYENGDIENLPVTILEPIAEALFTTPTYLLGYEEEVQTEHLLTYEQLLNEAENNNLVTKEKDFLEKGATPIKGSVLNYLKKENYQKKLLFPNEQ